MNLVASPRGDIARIRAVADDGRRLHLEYPSGQSATVDSGEPFDFDIGTVVLVSATASYIDRVPNELWPDEVWVGVVRLHLDDVTLVDASGTLRRVPTNETPYVVGNTVDCRTSIGVVRVLAEKPIRYLDLPGADDGEGIERFRVGPDPDGPTYADFGGFAHVVDRARELIEQPLKHRDQLTAIGARAIKGVLFTGQPGTGKTMLARIIANEAGATFYTISGPQVFSKWFGESEETLRRIFEDAAAHAPAIIFFDEIDSVATQRAESHEASRRVVAQLLTLMDGFAAASNVVVVAATNRPQDIDMALRRPGRFDWEIEFGLPILEDRRAILRASATGLNTTGLLPHDAIAAETDGWSSAELAAVWTEAALLAIADERSTIIAEDYEGGYSRVAGQRRRLTSESPRGSDQ